MRKPLQPDYAGDCCIAEDYREKSQDGFHDKAPDRWFLSRYLDVPPLVLMATDGANPTGRLVLAIAVPDPVESTHFRSGYLHIKVRWSKNRRSLKPSAE